MIKTCSWIVWRGKPYSSPSMWLIDKQCSIWNGRSLCMMLSPRRRICRTDTCPTMNNRYRRLADYDQVFEGGRLLAEFSEGRVIAATEVKTIGWKSSQYCWIVTGWWLWVDKDMRNTKDLLLCQVIPCFLDQLIRHTGTSSCLRDGQARLTKLGQYCVTSGGFLS